MRFLLFIITVSSIYSTTFFGYLKQTEMSFCMDDCAQYYIETEVDPGFGSINVILDNSNCDVCFIPNIDMYMNRFVEVELGEEIECIECSAYQINSIKLSDECQYPVDCWVDPCEVADECQLNTPVDCVANYCGGCYADFYDLEGNLVDCYSNECIDLSGLFFGWCDMYLGVGYSNLYDSNDNAFCQHLSGCGWAIDGVDYSDAFFETIEECESICDNDVYVCEDIQYDYDQLHSGDYVDCEFDNDCIAVWGDCDVGLGGCHYAVNEQLYLDNEVDSLVGLWLEEGCVSGVCDCLSLPHAVCSDNTCDTAYCFEENPAGCFQTGCEEGYECVVLPNDCVASSCFCDDNFNLYGSWICTEDCGGGTCVPISISGDFNNDDNIDILDVIILVNHILSPATVELEGADLNNDEMVNILDIIVLINIILSL